MTRRSTSFDGIALRACVPDDAPALALVGGATFLESYAGLLDGGAIVAHCQRQHSVEMYQKYLSSPACRAWIALANPGLAPVGYSLLAAPDLPLLDLAPSDVELKRIYLFSRYHGHGAGQSLMDQSILTAVQMGGRRLLLGVHEDNARAIAFYRRNLFEQVGTRTFQIGHLRYDDLVMGRSI